MLLLPDDATTTKLHSLNGQLQDGDIIFHTSTSHQSKAIQIATESEYSHMGIIYRQKGELYVFEAVQKVKLTKLSDWIRKGENQKYVVKRIKNAKELINSESLSRMKKAGERFLEKNTISILNGPTKIYTVRNWFGKYIRKL
ncbi:MAG: hypothetical protein HC830_09205 [Bacteroidetes bacterium]|nr:hypothetical protein [Bacteroidota bacterium]